MDPSSRRALLRAFGLTGAASFLPSLRPRGARAAAIPKRVVFFYTSQGILAESWVPKGVGGAPPTETAFELGEIMKPLQPWKDKLIVLNGLDMRSAAIAPGGGNAHEAAEVHAMTSDPRGMSIDQFIARDLRGRADKADLASLEIGVYDAGSSDGGNRPSFSGGGQRLPIEYNPRNAFRRLFPNGQPTGGAPAPAATSFDKSVLDFVGAEYAQASARASKTDRERLEAHADAVRDLERRLAGGKAAPVTGCPQVDVSMATSRGWLQANDAFVRTMLAALACDRTRVVTYSVALPTDDLTGYDRYRAGTPHVHEMCHQIDRNLRSDARAVAVVKKGFTMYHEQLGKLLEALSSIKESDGQTLLDHCAIVYCGQIARGNHSVNDLKWLVAGSAGGYFRTGRQLTFSPRQPHSNLFVSIANAMGVQTDTFGLRNACTGPLARMRA